MSPTRASQKSEGYPVLFFDGVCNLCNTSVDFIIKRDRERVFRFASLQSDAAQRLLAPFFGEETLSDSVLLLENGQLYARSEAAWRVARRLSGCWSILALVRWIPKNWRDAVYDRIARSRYRIFGRRESCRLTDSSTPDRFLVT